MTMPTLRKDGAQGRQFTFEDLKGLRAEGYIRDSTLDQRDGFGPEMQRRAIEGFARTYGLVLGSAWYTDFITGTSTLKRSGFRQALQDAQLDRFDVLPVYHTSRFARNRADAIRYKEELRKLGKVVVFVSQGIISGNDNDFLNEGINEVLDEHYSRNLSRWVRAGKAEKALRGHALGHAPLGYRHEKAASGRGAWAVPDEQSMPILLALLRGYASGEHSFKSLAQALNAQGYRTKRGFPFTEGSIALVIDNPFYSGKFRYHQGRPDEELKEGGHAVPEEVKTLWLRCQELRRQKRREGNPSPPSRQHAVYPLTGVLVCDGCGRPFHGVTLTSRRATKTPRMFHSQHRCPLTPRSVKARAIEEEFATSVLSCLHLDDDWREAVLRALTRESPEPDHSIEIKRIEGAMAALRKQHLWGVITDEEFKGEYQALERQKKALTVSTVAGLTPDVDRAAALLRDLPALWRHPGVTPAQQRDLAREVFEEVRLREGTLVAVKPHPVYAPLFAYSVWRHPVLGGDQSS